MPELPLSWSDNTSINSIYNFSRQLVATNRLDVLLDSIARHATEILQAKFCRLITFDSDTTLAVQSLYIDPSVHVRDQEKLRALPVTPRIYRQALISKAPIMVRRDDSLPIYWNRQEMGFDVVDCLALLPLRVESDAMGVLILGDQWSFSHDPFDENRVRLAGLIAEQAASAIHRVRLSNQLRENQISIVLALAKTLEKRHGETSAHCERMAELSEATARQMHCTPEEIQAIRWAAILHDIGKIAWPDHILEGKKKLSEEDWAIVKTHPQKGAEIVLMASKLEHVAFIILSHHEAYDGTGYPHGLKKTRIPLGARILTVCDAYMTMVDGRPYRAAVSHGDAIAEIKQLSGTRYDPRVVDTFVSLFN